MMKTSRLAWVLGSFTWLLSSCASDSASSAGGEFEGAPELAAFELNLSDDAEAEGLATEVDAVDPAADSVTSALAALSSALEQESAPELLRARHAIRDLNQAIRAFMQPIAALLRGTDPNAPLPRIREWGPVKRGQAEYRFVLRQGSERRYGWRLEARPAGSTDAFSIVAAGHVRVGAVARRGVGSLGLDLDALRIVDPTVHAAGKLYARFAHGPVATRLSYGLHEFTPNPEQNSGVDAWVQGVHVSTGFNRVRLAFHGNLPETATDAEELVLMRVRHHRAEGGRADAIVSGGDVPDGKLWVVSECWAPELASVYRIVRECERGEAVSELVAAGSACTVVKTTGDRSACPGALRDPQLPPSDPNAADVDMDDGEETLLPPDAMPSGEADVED
ncbi:MAG TPA: hypothetical protein VFQ61_00695 [Polyangiaceae bacterium]|nr:hypothetical protein [Polyangiaceae bacterium]